MYEKKKYWNNREVYSMQNIAGGGKTDRIRAKSSDRSGTNGGGRLLGSNEQV